MSDTWCRCWVALVLAGVVAASAQSRPPAWSPLPDLEVSQNVGRARLLDLYEHATDPDTPVEALLFNLLPPRKYTNEGGANLTLDDNRYLSAEPSPNWVGEETWTVEVTDGDHVAYRRFVVSVRSSQAGELIEAESAARVERVGEWVQRWHQGADYLSSNRVGDRLRLRFAGRFAAARLWTGDLLSTARYYEGRYEKNRYAFLSDWKSYRQGSARIVVDGVEAGSVDLSTSPWGGWNELLLVSALAPGEHVLEIVVEQGYVSVDRFRTSPTPLLRTEVEVTDSSGTPLADVLVSFVRPDRPDIVLRTDYRGRSGSFYGLSPGTYDVAVEASSNPGYLRGDPVEEKLLPERRSGVQVRGAEANLLRFELSYSEPFLSSVGLIERPRGTIPALVRPGEILTIECATDEMLADPTAELFNDLKRVGLPILEQRRTDATPGRSSGLRVSVQLPDDLPSGLWHLRMRAAGVEEVARRAVAVRSTAGHAGRDGAYRYVQISDTHLRDSAKNREHADHLLALAEEINLLSPAFVVMTGDLTDTGSRPEYLRLLEVLESFAVPTFAVPGNHDHYSWWTRYLYRGRDEYGRYLGRGFYQFRLGADRYIVVDTAAYQKIHDRHLPGAFTDQWTWLQQRLEEAKGAGEGLTTVLAHYDYTTNLPRRFAVSHQLVDLLAVNEVNVYVHGHLHRSFETPGSPMVLATGSTIRGEYRVVEVEGSKVVRYPRMQAGDLGVDWHAANDGSLIGSAAEISNRSAHALAGLRLPFLLRAATGGYDVEGGRIEEVLVADDGKRALVSVAVDLAPERSRLVSVTAATP